MKETIYETNKFDRNRSENYFYRIKGNDILEGEELEYAKSIFMKLYQEEQLTTTYQIYDKDEFHIEQGVIRIQNVEIPSKLFEHTSFRDIICIMVFLITISDGNKKEELGMMRQYYESMWRYSALHGEQTRIIQKLTSDIMTEYNNQNVAHTQVLGPGYYGMALEENRKIYNLLNGEKMGIRLGSNNQYVPENTICGLVASFSSIEEDLKNIFLHPCQYCLSSSRNCGFCVK